MRRKENEEKTTREKARFRTTCVYTRNDNHLLISIITTTTYTYYYYRQSLFLNFIITSPFYPASHSQ